MDFVTQARAAVDAELDHARRAAAGNPALLSAVNAIGNAFAVLIATAAGGPEPPVVSEPQQAAGTGDAESPPPQP